MKCTLRFLKDQPEAYGGPRAGDLVEYETWPQPYRGEGPEEREARGCYVVCRGHGDFEVFQAGVDVEVTPR